jgi:hypothetical protein
MTAKIYAHPALTRDMFAMLALLSKYQLRYSCVGRHVYLTPLD